MRLIDANALKDRLNTTFWTEINNIIDSAPTIEIVRCKDCKYWWETEETNYGDCNQFKVDTMANDFCSYGVKQTERNEQHTCNNCKFETNEWFDEKCDSCCGAHSNWQPQTAKG